MEHRQKIGEANKGNQRPDLREFNIRRAASGGYNGEKNGHYGKPVSEDARAKMSQKRREYYEKIPPEIRQQINHKLREYNKGRPLSTESREKISLVRKRQWQDPSYVAKLIKAMNTKPNKVETRLIEILAGLPDFQYNGDFRLGVSLGGLIPDFVNVNGKKQVIEVFGRYWHSPKVIGDDIRRTEAGKIAIYDSLGYKCLILWDDYLKKKTDQEILDSIVSFSKGEAKCQV